MVNPRRGRHPVSRRSFFRNAAVAGAAAPLAAGLPGSTSAAAGSSLGSAVSDTSAHPQLDFGASAARADLRWWRAGHPAPGVAVHGASGWAWSPRSRRFEIVGTADGAFTVQDGLAGATGRGALTTTVVAAAAWRAPDPEDNGQPTPVDLAGLPGCRLGGTTEHAGPSISVRSGQHIRWRLVVRGLPDALTGAALALETVRGERTTWRFHEGKLMRVGEAGMNWAPSGPSPQATATRLADDLWLLEAKIRFQGAGSPIRPVLLTPLPASLGVGPLEVSRHERVPKLDATRPLLTGAPGSGVYAAWQGSWPTPGGVGIVTAKPFVSGGERQTLIDLGDDAQRCALIVRESGDLAIQATGREMALDATDWAAGEAMALCLFTDGQTLQVSLDGITLGSLSLAEPLPALTRASVGADLDGRAPAVQEIVRAVMTMDPYWMPAAESIVLADEASFNALVPARGFVYGWDAAS